MSFSQRLGLIPNKIIQIESMDFQLKRGLWNSFYQKIIFDQKPSNVSALKNCPSLAPILRYLWSDFFHFNLNDLPMYVDKLVESIQEKYRSYQWNQVYDFIESIIEYYGERSGYIGNNFVDQCNSVMQREMAGYRIVNNLIVPITSEIEVTAIASATSSNNSVNIHLTTSLQKLSDRDNPDYRNSIKESISAVEAICSELTGENTLGQALNKFEKSGIIFNGQFKAALEKLYAYTNNKETGIRHSYSDEGKQPDFDDAKFMLVTCSAFVNYLVSKSILLKKSS